jgi:hypothetical protein
MKPFLSTSNASESLLEADLSNVGIPELRSGVDRVMARVDEWLREHPSALSAEARSALARDVRALRTRVSSALERGDLVSVSRCVPLVVTCPGALSTCLSFTSCTIISYHNMLLF